VETVDGGFELVGPYVDQSQLTGLLVQLFDLHISYGKVNITGAELTLYRDQLMSIDNEAITIDRHTVTGRGRRIPFAAIQRARPIRLQFLTGRHQLVGVSPGRPRTYFHWDRNRGRKRCGIELDLGRAVRIGLTPEDPDTVLKLIAPRLDPPRTTSTPRPGFIGRVLSRQAGHPRGLLGRIIGRAMVNDTKTANQAAIELLNPQPGENVLEIGFGPGRTIAALARSGANVTGFEVSDTMRAQAAAHNRDAIAKGQVELIVGDGTDLPLPTGATDAIVTIHTIYFWPNPTTMIDEMMRVLQPGGHLVLAFHAGEEDIPDRFDLDIYRFHSSDAVVEALETAGFVDVTASTPPRIDSKQRLVHATKPE
jgi:protein-L-isoaspartate O-methyltransferase